MDTNPSLMDFVQVVSQILGVSEIEAALLVGGVFSVVFFGLVSRLVFKMGVWGKARAAPYEPMQAFTTKTPMQVIQAARSASMKLLFTRFAIILFILACVGLYLNATQPGLMQTISQTIVEMLRSVLSR